MREQTLRYCVSVMSESKTSPLASAAAARRLISLDNSALMEECGFPPYEKAVQSAAVKGREIATQIAEERKVFFETQYTKEESDEIKKNVRRGAKWVRSHVAECKLTVDTCLACYLAFTSVDFATASR